MERGKDSRAVDGLAWSTWPRAARLLATGRTSRPALPVCLVVGTVLTLVNQGSVLMHGQVSLVTLARVVANYLIPYVVSSIGLLSAHRTRRRQAAAPADPSLSPAGRRPRQSRVGRGR